MWLREGVCDSFLPLFEAGIVIVLAFHHESFSTGVYIFRIYIAMVFCGSSYDLKERKY